MDNNIVMRSADALSAKEAKCYATIENERYLLMNAKNIEATAKKNKVTVERMGARMVGHKTVGLEGTGSATFHYNMSIFRKLMTKYKDTGEDVYFDMQITNYDKTSSVGRQTVILKDCNMDSSLLAKMSAGDEIIEETMDFTFDDWNYPEVFNMLNGMQ